MSFNLNMGKQDLGSYYDPNQSNVNNHNFPNQIARSPTPDVSVVNPQNVKHASHYSKSSNASAWQKCSNPKQASKSSPKSNHSEPSQTKHFPQ